MRGVEEEFQSVFAGYGLQFLDGSRAPPHMDANDAGRSRRDLAADVDRIEVVGMRVYIRENRRNALPMKSVGGGDEGI